MCCIHLHAVAGIMHFVPRIVSTRLPPLFVCWRSDTLWCNNGKYVCLRHSFNQGGRGLTRRNAMRHVYASLPCVCPSCLSPVSLPPTLSACLPVPLSTGPPVSPLWTYSSASPASLNAGRSPSEPWQRCSPPCRTSTGGRRGFHKKDDSSREDNRYTAYPCVCGSLANNEPCMLSRFRIFVCCCTPKSVPPPPHSLYAPLSPLPSAPLPTLPFPLYPSLPPSLQIRPPEVPSAPHGSLRRQPVHDGVPSCQAGAQRGGKARGGSSSGSV